MIIGNKYRSLRWKEKRTILFMKIEKENNRISRGRNRGVRRGEDGHIVVGGDQNPSDLIPPVLLKTRDENKRKR